MADVFVAKGTTNVSGTYTVNAGDNLIFNEGEQTVNAGVDFSATSRLGDVIVKRRFTGNIVDLTYACSTSTTPILHYNAGGGSMSVIVNGSTTDTVPKIWHTGLGALTVKTNGTITEFQQDSGSGYIEDSITVTNIRLAGGSLNQKYKSTLNTSWTIAGGMFTTGRGVSGTANIGGGTVVVAKEDGASSNNPTAGTLNIIGPARVVWNGGAVLSALNLLHPDAVFDWRNAPAAFAINALTGFAKAIKNSNLPVASAQTVYNMTNKAVTLTAATATIYVGKPEYYLAFGSSGGASG